jgi:hypothetical protein
MRTLLLVLLVASPLALAQAVPQAPAKAAAKVERKSKLPKAPTARMQDGMGPQYGGLQDTTKKESRRFNTLSDTSRKRHDKAANAIQNER